MKITTRSWFTLIELMIVIVIIWFLGMLSFVPYNYYSNVSKVRISSERLSQILNEARLNSESLQKDSKNINVWLFFNVRSSKIIEKYFPISYTWPFNETNWNIIKEFNLENDITVSEIKDTFWTNQNKISALFLAPNWNIEFYKEDWTSTWSF